MKPKRHWLRVFFVLSLIFVAFLVCLSGEFLWRAKVIEAKATGQLPEIPFFTLVSWLRPRTPVYLGGLATVPNVNAAIANDRTTSVAAENGARIFSIFCQKCHG